MQLIHITCLLLFLLASHLALADDESSTETNEIIPREAIQKLDFSVRQALLRAIVKLEKEANEDEENANENDDADSDPGNTTIIPTTITTQSTTALPATTATKEEILEESTSRSDIYPSIQFFTATYDEHNAQEQPLALFISKTKNKTHTNLGSPVLVTTSVKEELKDNNQAARSVKSNVQANEISLNSQDEIKFEIRNSKTKLSTTTEAYTTTTTTTPRPKTTKKRTTTTSTTTTTTTPRPTHNEDGENIEVVAKDDIRIQAAPLVSAFTVDLDESGAAKKVVPIIDSPVSTTASVLSNTQRTSLFQSPSFGPTITKLNVLPSDAHRSAARNSANNLPASPTQATFSSSTVNNIFSNMVPTSGHYITKQPQTTNFNQKQPQEQQQQSSNVNNYLIEKQRELEQQIYQLKLQAQQQQELILRQLKLLEEQAKLKGTSNSNNNNPISADTSTQNHVSTNFLQTHIGQQQQQPQQLALLQRQQEPGFTIRPSIEFIASSQSKIAPIYPTISLEQQLPLKQPNGKYINGGHQQHQQSNRFANSVVQPQNQQQPQQRLPTDVNPIQHVFQKLQNLQNLQNLHKSNTQTASSISNIQIQPSNQLNISPTFASLLPQAPAELSLLQALPQRNYQQFQQSNLLVPQYVTDALLEQQQQQQQQQQQNRARLFRQEDDTGNFGINQVQTQPNSNNIFSSYNLQQQPTNNFDNQNFYRQHLIPAFSNQLQQNAQTFYQQQQQQTQQNSPTVLALNHGINNFAQQTLLPTAQAS